MSCAVIAITAFFAGTILAAIVLAFFIGADDERWDRYQ